MSAQVEVIGMFAMFN